MGSKFMRVSRRVVKFIQEKEICFHTGEKGEGFRWEGLIKDISLLTRGGESV